MRERWLRALPALIGLLLFIGALEVLRRELHAVTWPALSADVRGIPGVQLFVALLMTWIIGWTASEAEGWVREFVTYMASVSHLDSFSKGTLELKDVVYFLSIITLGLFATNRAVEAHRWS